MPKILQLDRHVADLIAAGEVVERPASAVKELVENAVDAGATQITVEIQNGGMTYLRVTDNGCGIAPEDAETAFLRHATSKLRTKEDLAAIGTMGFRGEALAAIASVSKIDLMTKTRDHEGLSLTLEAGTVVDRSPAGCPDGTTIVVRDLFYNTPARLKFMKRDTVEASQVAGAVQRQALAHPEIAFRLLKEGETVLQTAGTGDLHGTLYQVFGRQLAVDMLAVQSQWENYRLTGYVTKPTATRGNRNYQQFFVNDRPVRSKLLTSALEEAYANQMMVGRFPSCVLRLELPRDAVDVNVHPAKTEVKFANERAVFDCVRFGVLSVLNKAPAKPEMVLEKKPAPKEQAFRTMNTTDFRAMTQVLSQPSKPVAPNVAQAMLRQSRLPYEASAPTPTREEPPRPAPQEAPKMPLPEKQEDFPLYEAAKPANMEPELPVQEPMEERPVPGEPNPVQEQTALPLEEAPSYRIVGEVLNTYIILEQADNVLFLDKHAAHERILFEKLKAQSHDVMAQVLLSPFRAQLSKEEAGILLDNHKLLARCGYEIEDFGGGDVLVRQIPADLDPGQAELTLQELAGNLLSGQRKDPEGLLDEVLHTIACKAAIKAGYHTEPAERAALVRQVMERDDIKYCPHGRPVITTLTKQQLERQFKR